MKQQITPAEFSLLDSLAVAADGIQDAQESIVNAIVGLLAIDHWDELKIKTVREFVATGYGPVERLTDGLGVTVGAKPEVFVP